jgi:hypothetical protein
MRELGANEKAVIFTESRRTQRYLKEMLVEQGYNVVMFNDQNSDSDAKRIYEWWIEKHQYDDKITGSKTADMVTFVLSVILSIIISVFTASESIKAGIKEQGYQDYGEHTLTLLDINTKQDFTLKNIKTEKVGEYQIVRFGMSTQNWTIFLRYITQTFYFVKLKYIESLKRLT